jgi:hypothetical protein
MATFPVRVAPLLIAFVSGQVFKGSWKRAPVALKVLVMEDGAAPSSMVRQNILDNIDYLAFTLNRTVYSQ